MSEDIGELDKGEMVDIVEYWHVLVRRRRLIILMTLAAFVLSIIVSLLLPVRYSATTSILPPRQTSNMLSSLATALPSGFNSVAAGLLGGNDQGATWVGILRSNNVKDGVIEEFGLIDIYGVETMENARRSLSSLLAVSMSKKDSIISVTVEDRSPERAADMANAFIKGLDRVNRSMIMSSGQRTRLFVEKRLVEAKSDLANAEDNLMRFQEKNKVVKLDTQSIAIIESIGTVKGELMAREVELSTLLSYATNENPRVLVLKAQINGLKVQVNELEVGKASKSGTKKKSNIIIPTDLIPDLSLEYGRLLRDTKVQQRLYGLLVEQYEMARIQEARDTSTVQLLDSARVPEKKSRPKRSLIVLTSTAMFFFLSIIFSFILEFIEKTKLINVADNA